LWPWLQRAWPISRQERRKKRSRELVVVVGQPLAIPLVQMSNGYKMGGWCFIWIQRNSIRKQMLEVI
jgi:hypothetical protein